MSYDLEKNGWKRFIDETRLGYRKNFRGGSVSIYEGGGTTNERVVFSYGPNHNDSMTGTRWLYYRTISVEEAAEWIDLCNGYHVPYPLDRDLYDKWHKANPRSSPTDHVMDLRQRIYIRAEKEGKLK